MRPEKVLVADRIQGMTQVVGVSCGPRSSYIQQNEEVN